MMASYDLVCTQHENEPDDGCFWCWCAAQADEDGAVDLTARASEEAKEEGP